MKMKVTRAACVDERLYSVEFGGRTRPGMMDHELKHWLLDLGVGDSTIIPVLAIAPSETITVDVPEAYLKRAS
jgi:hypothetical protein